MRKLPLEACVVCKAWVLHTHTSICSSSVLTEIVGMIEEGGGGVEDLSSSFTIFLNVLDIFIADSSLPFF